MVARAAPTANDARQERWTQSRIIRIPMRLAKAPFRAAWLAIHFLESTRGAPPTGTTMTNEATRAALAEELRQIAPRSAGAHDGVQFGLPWSKTLTLGHTSTPVYTRMPTPFVWLSAPLRCCAATSNPPTLQFFTYFAILRFWAASLRPILSA